MKGASLLKDAMWWPLLFLSFIFILLFFEQTQEQEDCPSEPPLCQRISRDFQHVEEDHSLHGTPAKRLKPETSHTPWGLVNSYQSWRVSGGSSLTSEKKERGEEEDNCWETQISCLVSRSGFVHRQVLRLGALCTMGSYKIISTLCTSHSRWAAGAQKLRGIHWIRFSLDLCLLSLKPGPIH